MTVRVKICGITNEADARQAIDAGADAIGFVFVPGTPRWVTVESLAEWVRRLPPLVSRVGLFVDAEPNWIRGVIRETGIDTVQLHGDEPPGLARDLRNEVRVLKAFRIRGSETLRRLPDYREAADAFLLDAYVSGQSGGTGTTFDWEQAVAARQLGVPVILAGGLTPENVAEAIRRTSPYAVDVSSGVERSPGRKDPDKVRRFIAEAKGVEWER